MDYAHFTRQRWGQTNHALLYFSSKARREWLFQLLKASASELNESGSLRQLGRLWRWEWQDARRVRRALKAFSKDIAADKDLARLRPLFLEYNWLAGRVEVTSSRHAEGSSFLLAPFGSYLKEADNLTLVTQVSDIYLCEALRTLIARHDPAMAEKLKKPPPRKKRPYTAKSPALASDRYLLRYILHEYIRRVRPPVAAPVKQAKAGRNKRYHFIQDFARAGHWARNAAVKRLTPQPR